MNKKLSLALVFTLLSSFAWEASAKKARGRTRTYPYEFSAEYSDLKCAFDSTFVIGNAISSGLLQSVDLLFPGADYGQSPARVLSLYFNGSPSAYKNISQGWGMRMQTGSNFTHRIIEGGEAEAYQTIIGVDMYYMSSVFQTCDYTNMSYFVSSLVEYANENNKNLILGTVPEEDFATFDRLSKVFIFMEPHMQCSQLSQTFEKQCLDKEAGKDPIEFVPGQNFPEQRNRLHDCPSLGNQYYQQCMQRAKQGVHSCAKDINDLVDHYCTPDKNCYIADLREIVSHLNQGESYAVTKKGAKEPEWFDRKALRPNGVNVSAAGTQVLINELLRNMKDGIESSGTPLNCR